MRDHPRRAPATQWAFCPKCKRQVRVKGKAMLRCRDCGAEFRPTVLEEKR